MCLAIFVIDNPRKLEVDNEKKIQDLQRQLDHVRRAAEGDTDRIRRRADAEITELKQSLAALENKLEKVSSY